MIDFTHSTDNPVSSLEEDTSVNPADPRGMDDVFLSFADTVIAVRTDVRRISAFLRQTYALMLAQRAAGLPAAVTVFRRQRGYTLSGRVYRNATTASLRSHLNQAILAAFVAARKDLLWLHAGVVCRGEHALLIVAPSAQGKSTLVAHLCELGWTFMSDEAAPVAMASASVQAWPRSPVRRRHPGRELNKLEMGELERIAWTVPRSQLGRSPARISGIVVPQFVTGATPALEPLSKGMASMALARNAINFRDHGDAALAFFARLVDEVPCLALAYENCEAAARLVHDELPLRFREGT
jgi:hypothetical protein